MAVTLPFSGGRPRRAVQITANGNGFAGLAFGQGTLTTYVPSVISASNNTFGLFLNDANLIAPFDGARFRLESNTVGMSLGLGTHVLIAGGLTVQSNGAGVLADGAGTTDPEIDSGKPLDNHRERHRHAAALRDPVDHRGCNDRHTLL